MKKCELTTIHQRCIEMYRWYHWGVQRDGCLEKLPSITKKRLQLKIHEANQLRIWYSALVQLHIFCYISNQLELLIVCWVSIIVHDLLNSFFDPPISRLTARFSGGTSLHLEMDKTAAEPSSWTFRNVKLGWFNMEWWKSTEKICGLNRNFHRVNSYYKSGKLYCYTFEHMELCVI